MPDRESMFSRLFRYAKGDPNVALENFTTEAVRTAIEADPAPMLRALQGAVPGTDLRLAYQPGGLVSGATGLTPRTQVVVAPHGTLDLVLEVTGLATATEVLVEVKTGAPETKLGADDPGQLERYREYMMTADDDVRRALVTLSESGFPGTAWLRWEALWVAVRSTSDRSRMWDDLLQFLKEQKVADESLMPMSARESAALGDAARLLNKVARVLEEIHREGKNKWGTDFNWYVPALVRNPLYSSLVNTGKLTLAVGWRRDAAWIYPGLVELNDEAHWCVSVEMVKRAPNVRKELFDLASHLRTDLWTAHEQGEVVAVSVVRAVELYTHERAVDWLMARLDDLAVARILDKIVQKSPEELGHQSVPGVPEAESRDLPPDAAAPAPQ